MSNSVETLYCSSELFPGSGLQYSHTIVFGRLTASRLETIQALPMRHALAPELC